MGTDERGVVWQGRYWVGSPDRISRRLLESQMPVHELVGRLGTAKLPVPADCHEEATALIHAGERYLWAARRLQGALRPHLGQPPEGVAA
jgi:hypothetical protein